MISPFRHSMLYVHTLRHLTWKQIGWRLRRYLKAALPKRILKVNTPDLSQAALAALDDFIQDLSSTLPEDADVLKVETAWRTQMKGAGKRDSDSVLKDTDLWSRLWLYMLHGWEYYLPMLLSDRAADQRMQRRIILDWIEFNPADIPGVAWEPYPTSRRLLHWAQIMTRMEETDDEILLSVAVQLHWLSKRLEYDLSGNHLLSNAAALVVAGSVLNDPLREKGIKILQQELAEQILTDGAHYERSPMYHCRMMEELLLVAAVCESVPDWLSDALRRMAGFLRYITPEGAPMPLFGDSVYGETWPPEVLCALVEQRIGPPIAPADHHDSGIVVLAQSAGHLALKMGPAGPDHQMAHAHNDLLSFELSLNGKRLIVDAGSHGYAESDLRPYCRSIRAHNTVQVEEHEPLECWKTFRVARRPEILPSVQEENTVSGGYRAYQGFTHRRRVTAAPEGFWVVADSLEAAQPFCYVSRIHLHPDTHCDRLTPGWRIVRDDATAYIVPFGVEQQTCHDGTQSPEEHWYCPRFGEATPMPTLCFSGKAEQRVRCGYAIVPENAISAFKAIYTEDWQGDVP